ncbi:MAG: hypothetical protein EON88_09050 [Brevundimonas sp.]|nr:MAG: hypothetical protein EON88_09050 [Brevundimonas sp.]
MSGGHGLERARRLLALPEGWLGTTPGGYAVRTGPDRRARVMLTLDEADFRALTAHPGLKTRPGGGWTARAAVTARTGPQAGRPGVTDGLRVVMEADGRAVERQANLTTSAVAWLAGRADADGARWLSRAEVAAAELLALEAERAQRGPGLTMQWDALPGPRSGRGARRAEPGDPALAAARRVAKALAACAGARTMVEHICIRATPLQAAEQSLGLRRRTGKAVLKQGLAALARHYRLA